MTFREYLRWQKFYAIEPFGPQRDNLHAALVCALLANIHRKKNSAPIGFEAFMLGMGKAKRNNNVMGFFGSRSKKSGSK